MKNIFFVAECPSWTAFQSSQSRGLWYVPDIPGLPERPCDVLNGAFRSKIPAIIIVSIKGQQVCMLWG